MTFVKDTVRLAPNSTPLRSVHMTPANVIEHGEHEPTDNLARCLSLLTFPEEDLRAFCELPPIKTPQGDEVPAAYVRARIPRCKLRPQFDPDYTISVYQGSCEEPVGHYMMHDIVWASQCLTVLEPGSDGPQRVCRVPDPAAEAVETFVHWLYTGDQQSLYESLVEGNDTSPTFAISFCQLVRASGCINYKIGGVIRALYSLTESEAESSDNVPVQEDDEVH